MNKKKIAALLTALTLSVSCMAPAFAADEKEKEPTLNKITIEFRVGDSVLEINGKKVTVTTPYEVDGTTLVPLRVITEAFGAEVDWDETEERVTLNYEGVEIKIWIGKKESTVNGQKLMLLQAPELANDTTMVPLRFITENFGADVSYDAETEGIIVEKVTTESNSIIDFSQVLHNTTKEYVGDSYLGWSMKYNKDLRLAYREFAGMRNIFVTDEEDVRVYMTVDRLPKDQTLDTIYSKMKEESKSYTVIEQEKKSDSFYLELKSAKDYIIDKIIIKNDKVFRCTVYISADSVTAKKAAYQELVDSFTTSFSGPTKVEDLSDAVDGYRTYDNKAMKFKLDLPADWHDASNDDVANVYQFVKSDPESIISFESATIEIVSLDSKTVDSWAKQEYEKNQGVYNQKLYSMSEIDSMKIAGQSAKHFKVIKELKDDRLWSKTDIFFSLGDYAYKLSLNTISKDGSSAAQRIIDSFELEELDRSEVGKLMLPEDDDTKQTVKHATGGYSFQIPATWEYKIDASSGAVRCVDLSILATVTLSNHDNPNNVSIRDYFDYVLEQMKSEKKVNIVTKTTSGTVGGVDGYYFEYEQTIEDQIFFTKFFGFKLGDQLIFIDVTVMEEAYGTNLETVFGEIVESIQLDE